MIAAVQQQEKIVQGLILWKSTTVEGRRPGFEASLFWISRVRHHQLDARIFLQSLEIGRHALASCLQEVIKTTDQTKQGAWSCLVLQLDLE